MRLRRLTGCGRTAGASSTGAGALSIVASSLRLARRDMTSLKTISIGSKQAWPAAEFWERYDKGEFK